MQKQRAGGHIIFLALDLGRPYGRVLRGGLNRGTRCRHVTQIHPVKLLLPTGNTRSSVVFGYKAGGVGSHLGREFDILCVCLTCVRWLPTADYRCMHTRRAPTALGALAQRVGVATAARGAWDARLPAAPGPRAAVGLGVRLAGAPKVPGHRTSSRGSRSWDLAAAG
jgi:hypothetical protein